MKNCPLSSERKIFEDYGCLFANLAAYYLEGYLFLGRWLILAEKVPN